MLKLLNKFYLHTPKCTLPRPVHNLFSTKSLTVTKNDKNASNGPDLHMDWEEWINQHPDFCREEALNFKKKCIDEELKCDENSVNIEQIDWDDWRKKIKTPGVVDLIEGEFDATETSNYGQFYYDHLTEDAKAEILDANSKYSNEVDFIGREMIVDGVEKTFKKKLVEKIESAKELTELSSAYLEELYKDKEQLDMKMKRYLGRSIREDMSEYPEMAREFEESFVGNGYGNGIATFPNDTFRQSWILMGKEDWKDKEHVESSLRINDDVIEHYLSIWRRMGVKVEKAKYIEDKYLQRQEKLKQLRAHCASTRGTNSKDPETGEYLMEDDDFEWVKIPGGG